MRLEILVSALMCVLWYFHPCLTWTDLCPTITHTDTGSVPDSDEVTMLSLLHWAVAPGRECAHTSLLLYLIASLISLLPGDLIVLLSATNQPTGLSFFSPGKLLWVWKTGFKWLQCRCNIIRFSSLLFYFYFARASNRWSTRRCWESNVWTADLGE